MVARKRAPTALATGAYAWVRDRLEADYAEWSASVHNTGRDPFPRQHLLDKLRCGEAVTIRAVSLPSRYGGVPKPATHREALATEFWRHQNEVLTVYPDDRVVPATDDSDLFAEYRNL